MNIALKFSASNATPSKEPVSDYKTEFVLREFEGDEVLDCGTITFDKMDGVSEQRLIHHDGRYWRQEEVGDRCYDVAQVLDWRRGSPARVVDRMNPNFTSVGYSPEGKPFHDLSQAEKDRLLEGVAHIRKNVLLVDGVPFIACEEPMLEVRLFDTRVTVLPTLASSTISSDAVLFPLAKGDDAREFAERLAHERGGLRVLYAGEVDSFRPVEVSHFNETAAAIKRLRHAIDACAPMLLAASLNDENTARLMAFRQNIDPNSMDLMFEAEELCTGLEGEKSRPEVDMFLQKVGTIRFLNAFLSNQLDDKPAPGMG